MSEIGVKFDNNELTFEKHTADICRKVSRKT